MHRSLLASALTLLAAAPAFAQGDESCAGFPLVGGNGGGVGGAVYFDVDCALDTWIGSISTNLRQPAGQVVQMELFTKPGTASGFENSPGAWTSRAIAVAPAAGPDEPTVFHFNGIGGLPPGVTGVALVALDGSHRYTNGSSTRTSTDDRLVVTPHSATNAAFSGTVFPDRIWNGEICAAHRTTRYLRTTDEFNNGGLAGGAVYFDLTVHRPVRFRYLHCHFSAPSGTAVGLDIFAKPGTAFGHESDPSAWTQVASDSWALAPGPGEFTTLFPDQPLAFAPGTYGIALVAQGTGHLYTNGNGRNDHFVSLDGAFEIQGGTASNVPFSGTTISPRVWNGGLYRELHDAEISPRSAVAGIMTEGSTAFFDVVTDRAVEVEALLTQFRESGARVDFELWTTPGGFAGKTQNPSVWNLRAIGDGTKVTAGGSNIGDMRLDQPTTFNGRTGCALIVHGGRLRYGPPMPSTPLMLESEDGVVRIEYGPTTSGRFSGTQSANVSMTVGLRYVDDEIGYDFCDDQQPNSTGEHGELSVRGSARVADNDVRLFASRLPQNATGFFLTSPTFLRVPLAGGAQGDICIAGASIGRYVGPGQVRNSSTNGHFELAIDLNQHPTPNGLVSVLPGETWHFQCWHRDANPGPTSNFTEAQRVLFR